MNPLTREWVDKAEGDFAPAARELRARKSPNYDAACFHAQQCAEKFLKAILHDAGKPFPKTHDLVMLLERVVRLDASWELLRTDMEDLTTYAVAARYPGWAAERRIARRALAAARMVRERARMCLGLRD